MVWAVGVLHAVAPLLPTILAVIVAVSPYIWVFVSTIFSIAAALLVGLCLICHLAFTCATSVIWAAMYAPFLGVAHAVCTVANSAILPLCVACVGCFQLLCALGTAVTSASCTTMGWAGCLLCLLRMLQALLGCRDCKHYTQHADKPYMLAVGCYALAIAMYHYSHFMSPLLLAILLMIGGIEVNPGPALYILAMIAMMVVSPRPTRYRQATAGQLPHTKIDPCPCCFLVFERLISFLACRSCRHYHQFHISGHISRYQLSQCCIYSCMCWLAALLCNSLVLDIQAAAFAGSQKKIFARKLLQQVCICSCSCSSQPAIACVMLADTCTNTCLCLQICMHLAWLVLHVPSWGYLSRPFLTAVLLVRGSRLDGSPATA